MTGIVDYGMGNLRSVLHAFSLLTDDVKICNDPEEVAKLERVVVPGVGAFGECVANLRARGMADALNEAVLRRRRPTLGICLGMQAMARSSEEGATAETGLGWFDADVVRLKPDDPALRIPHVGWNDLIFETPCPLFRGVPKHPDFYFVHSFWMRCDRPQDVAATFDYGGPFTAAIFKDNLFATQFHPEKSQDHGLKVLENFLDWKP